MYHYIDDRKFLGAMKRTCSDIVNQLVQKINNESVLTVEAHLIGSGARNLITQNGDEPVDLDYNLCILEYDPFMSGQSIKNYVQHQFDGILSRNGWENCGDSTSALTTKKRHFIRGNQTEFSIDLGIIRNTDYGWHRLIHHKTGIIALDQWIWNDAPRSEGLDDKVRSIKEENLWNEVREVYLDKKNMYLIRNDHNHPSFIVYIETINEVYGKHFGGYVRGITCLSCKW